MVHQDLFFSYSFFNSMYKQIFEFSRNRKRIFFKELLHSEPLFRLESIISFVFHLLMNSFVILAFRIFQTISFAWLNVLEIKFF